MKNKEASPRFFLIDGSSYIYRAFHALPYLSNPKGVPTNAVYGFTNMLLKVIKDNKPDYIAVTFDHKGPTFRKEIYEDYKANRPEMPDSLKPQIPYIKDLVSAFSIPVMEKEGYEADDIIGTLAVRAEKEGMDVVIVTGDKDMMQLVNNRITIMDTMKDRTYGPQEVKERFGVEPSKVVEVMGLAGDSIDNIPGVPGIGEKTAIKLISQFGSIEEVFERVSEVAREKLRENLKTHESQARMSKKLVTLDTNVPIECSVKELSHGEPDTNRLKTLFKELGFSKFSRDITPEKRLSRREYHLVLQEQEFKEAVRGIEETGEFAVDLETTNKDPMMAELVGISFSYPSPSSHTERSFYIPLTHSYLGVPRQLDLSFVLDTLMPHLQDMDIKKYGQNIKYDYIVLKKYGIKIDGIDADSMVASYLLDPSKRVHNLDSLAEEHLGHKTITYKDIVGKGKNEMPFNEVRVEDATVYACEDAHVTLLLVQEFLPRLKEAGLTGLFRDIEVPLVEVLAEMEMAGIMIDKEGLIALSREMEEKIGGLQKRIYRIAGMEFNINSPKQLSEILFSRLGLKPVKKTKTGYSTNEDVLIILSSQHDLPAEILNYRHLTKLKSTYVDALTGLINPDTGRVHTSFNQTVTATGRLSSSEPNLQNIPIRSEMGKKIREAFIAGEGRLFLSADYSQIELRIMAHLSGDPLLIEAFENGEDIHSRTASAVFGTFTEDMREEMRRRAKAINFGVIYGMSPYGLSQEISVSMEEAGRYIDDYFFHHKGVKGFIDATIKEATEKGFVTTMFGRRRYIHELMSSNASVRGFGERTAINTPIQGTAADIIKKAMINIYRRFRDEGLKSLMVLQIHDELLFEVPQDELEKIKGVVREEMEGVIDLAVPVKVDLGTGRNWREAH
ncbi:MAG: DNA polymerase I [Thermodesulfobacteriota bacterium]